MKKAVAIIMLVLMLCSLTACKPGEKTEEEYSQIFAEAESKNAEKSQKFQEAVSEEMQEISDDLGKTVKNKKLVLFRETYVTKEYRVIMFNNKGIAKYMVTYYFAQDDQMYNQFILKGKEEKIYKKDKASKMVAFKNDDVQEASFDEFYKSYSDGIWQIIE